LKRGSVPYGLHELESIEGSEFLDYLGKELKTAIGSEQTKRGEKQNKPDN
jgi:hypothetical protein